MNVPDNDVLDRTYETFQALAKAATCKQCMAGVVREEFDLIEAYLRELPKDPDALEKSDLAAALKKRGVPKSQYGTSCTWLARVMNEAGKRPLNKHDLEFTLPVFEHWTGLRAVTG